MFKIIIAALALVLVAGCDSGPQHLVVDNLEQGPPGATGQQGPAGKDGLAGEQGPAGKDATISGSRLKALYWHGADGSRVPQGRLLDTELDLECSFQVLDPATPDEARCVPAFEVWEFSAFESPTCAETRVYFKDANGRKWARADKGFYRVAEPSATCYFINNDGACISCGPGDWYTWTSVPDSAFVVSTLGQ